MANETIACLRQIAALDVKLLALAKRRASSLEAVASAESASEDAKARLADRQGEVKRLRKEADGVNLDVAAVDQDIARLDGQLLGAKSNKEYEILTREIAAEKAKRSKFEDKGLEHLESADRIADEERAAGAAVEQSKSCLDEEKTAAAAVEAEVAGKEGGLTRERDAVMPRLNDEIRSVYERVLAQRKDSAMAKVVDGVCGGCARKLSPQMDNLVSVGQEVVQCMSCQRILYIGEGS